MIRPKAALAALALLTALGGAPAAVSQPDPVLSTAGFGPLTVGMTWRQAHAAMPSLDQGDTTAFDGCYEATSPRHPGLYVMFMDGRLARVSATENSTARTVSGVHVGTPEAEVRRIFPRNLVQQSHAYQDPPAKYLTFWASGRQRGVRFEIGSNGNVYAIHAGGTEIELVEGCA